MNSEEFDIEGNSLCIGINWGSVPVENSYFYQKNHEPIDLNLSCVMVNTDGKIEEMVTPNKLNGHYLAVKHSGNDKTGDLNGDDKIDNEYLTINLSKIQQDVSKIYIFLSAKNINYKELPHALFSVYNSEVRQQDKTISIADLKTEGSTQFADNILMCTIYKTNFGWKYKKNIKAFPEIKEMK